MKKILLVEDTAHLSEEIVDILRMEGFEVTSAQNAERGLEILSAAMPDLIITDLLMPGMDGFELIQRVRAMPSARSLPIIILSAKTSPEDRVRGTEVGANAFVQKPCKAHDLIESINELLKA
jgi:DNA-binding response OmpR family regulator